MKKSSFISIAIHAFALFLLSYNQNTKNNPSREPTPQTKIEIIYVGEEIVSSESRRVEKVQNQKTDAGIVNVNTSKENPLGDGIELQSQSEIVPVHTKQSDVPATPVPSANLTQNLPKFKNVEKKWISANSKESASMDHTAQDKYLWQNEAQQPKDTMAPELIQSGNHITGASSELSKDSFEFAEPIIPEPKTITAEKLSPSSPKSPWSKNATSKLAQAKLTMNDKGSESQKNIERSGSSHFSAAEIPILGNAQTGPKIAIAHQSKNELKKVLTEKKQFLGKDQNESHSAGNEQKYNPPKTHKTFVHFSLPNVAKKRSMPATPNRLHSFNPKKTPKPLNQARCKRTSTVVTPPAQQLKNFYSKRFITINDLLGQPMNWNAVRQQVTISHLMGASKLDRNNKMGNVSISDLLKNNAGSYHIGKTICIE